eukprot:CAMPEP_0172329420 /NCGR_PEP_ID=MMETSP1058-20130122/60872_1 /TAXON_ID=83371 /ORGANISM="Detonula confervacea, Strain CCMP 353" /LENGTH=222 /DNA_ID=CAMNT_0013046591 /DNA_START=557 /DNA_END=1222 /DNA_ORIENTATION=-
MTYFFAGKVLEDMPSEELQRWQTMVRKCVLEHSNRFSGDYSLRFKSLVTFPPGRNNMIVAVFEPSSALDDLYDELCELAVMEKESSRDKNCDDDTEKEYEFPLLKDLTRKQQKQRRQHRSPSWIAHVTLGNLAGGSKEDVNKLSEWLGNRYDQGDDTIMSNTDENGVLLESSTLEVKPGASSEPNNDVPLTIKEKRNVLESSIGALGLALGGPVPGHVDIDW